MAQNVEVNGRVVEFPDGMSADDIASAIKRSSLTMPAQIDRKIDPTAGGSTLNLAGFDTGIKTSQGFDRFMSGAGKAVSDLGSGVAQLFGANNQAAIDEHKKQDAPLMDTGAGLAGNVAGNVAMTVLPAGGIARGAEGLGMLRSANAARAFVNPTTYRGATAAGATVGGLQPVASDEDRTTNVLLGGAGGAVGQGVVNGLGRIAQPVKNALEPVRQKAVDTLQAAGVPLDLAQVTGSPTLNRIRSSLTDNLFTVGGQEAKIQAQKDAFTNAALGTMGAAGKATQDVMGDAEKRINGVFKDVLDRNTVKPQPGWMTALADAQSAAIEGEHGPVAKAISRVFGAMDPQTGEIPGQVAYAIKKDLDRYASSADSNQNFVARSARSALMDGINGSLSGADQQAFAQARGQFANMKKIEGAVSTDGVGDISPAKLANILGQKRNRPGSLYGKGPQELVDLAQSGKQVLADKTPNSGTTARILATALPGAAVGVGAQLATGDPVEALKYGGGVIAFPKLAQAVMNNPRMVGLLSQGVTKPTLRGLLESPQKNVAIGQGVRAAPLLGGRMFLLPADEQ